MEASSHREFKLIYEEHYANLCRAAYRILGEKESAREVVQEIFLDMWSKGNWNRLQSIKAYLYVSVYNRSITFLGKRKRFVSDDLLMHEASSDHHALENEELKGIIAKAINNLPQRCKEIFLLSREEEMTYGQIAAHLSLSVKTVEGQMGIALKKLREYLDKNWSREGPAFDQKINMFFI